MAHEVEKMMYVGQVPWHGLGTKFETAPSLEEAIKSAGLDWEVAKVALQTVGTNLDVPAMAIQRQTDKRILGVVGPDWNPLQNTKAFEFFKPFIDEKEASINTAGSLKKGQRVFILAKINRDPMDIVKGDSVEKYILLSNSHDGSQAVRVGFTPIRVVCANTLAMAIGDNASKLIRLRHTKNLHQAMESVQDVMNVANQQFEATAEQYRAMAKMDMNSGDLEKFIKLVFLQKKTSTEAQIAMSEGAESDGTDETTGGARLIERITPLFEKGRGNDMAGVKGTLWGAYNAITEYIQYDRGNSEETRLDQTWFGQGQVLNKRAMAVAKKFLDKAA